MAKVRVCSCYVYIYLTLLASDAAKKLPRDSIIICSPFKRTKDTAFALSRELGNVDVEEDDRLRERFFGTFDGQSNSAYEHVWSLDLKDSSHTNYQTESVDAVRKRMWSVILDLESRYSCRNIVLVSHGDPLQILETRFLNVPGTLHRQAILPLGVCDVRQVSY